MDEKQTAIILAVLKKIPIFATLDETSHQQIIKKITLQHFPKDQIIFHEGDTGDALYIIKNGSVIVYHEPKETGLPEETVAVLKENKFFGEMALVSSEPRNASVRALADSDIFVLKKEDFDMLISENAEIAAQISTTFVERLKQNE